jgi:hypothetical protein
MPAREIHPATLGAKSTLLHTSNHAPKELD